ncbi:uncharacterized protein LOC125014804 isoform X2 [Mugil cephalus]|uniref:uncharacterized protein LOC125014804 isoform X2 n=1 Tax=Mugil cephalus TaxID=48193 RepID=UPI001FB71677|nr:uncharacterized protein LOC125014804 isoform X2 [Mugil cephalus]
MKLWSRICFLVLALPLVSRGEQNNSTTPTPGDATEPPQGSSDNDTITEPLFTPTVETGVATATAPSTENGPSNDTTLLDETDDTNEPNKTVTTIENKHQHTTSSVTTVSMVDSTTAAPSTDLPGEGQNVWGYVVMALIIVVMIILLVFLYILRRAARTYSFDLQRPPSANHFNEPSGTFEQVYVDDLEQPVPMYTIDDLSTPPVANGTSLQPEEKTSVEESAAQEQPDANGVESSPPNTSPSLGDEQADKTSDPSSSTDLFLDCIGEQQNENNNNPSVCSTDPFVEINLDEPEWCDQLIASTDAPSSTLPLSSFSFSSSSSS